MLFGGGSSDDIAAPMAAAASSIVLAAMLPSQPATLRGSEATLSISEELTQEIFKVTEEAAAQVASEASADLLGAFGKVGTRALEGLVIQAAIAVGTNASEAAYQACRRRRSKAEEVN